MIMKNVSKRMYKFSVMIIFLGVFLLMPKEVMAKHDCSKSEYACISCSTSYEKEIDVTWTIWATDKNGNGKVEISYAKKGNKISNNYFNGSKNFILNVTGLTAFSDWIKDGKLQCLDKIYAYQNTTPAISSGSGGKSSYNLSFYTNNKKGNGQGAKKLKTQLVKSSDNGKQLEGANSCKYTTKAAQTDESVTITVNVIGDKITTVTDNESRFTADVSSLKVSQFQNGCPKLSFSCQQAGNGTMEICTLKKKSKSAKDRINEIIIDGDNEISCDIFGLENEGSVGWILQKIFDYIKVIGPILVVLLSAIDFIKAILSSDEKAMKQAQSRLVIRLIAAIALFLLPTLIQLAMSIINQATCTLK